MCCALSPEQLASLNRISYRRRYAAGRMISGPDAEDWFANVLSGVVKLTKTLPDGRQQIVELLFPSDFLGRPFRAGGGYAAEAATAVELCCFSRQHFESLMHEWPNLKQLFLERTLDEVDAAREWMLLLGRKSAEEKVAALILLVLRRMRAPGRDAAMPSTNRPLRPAPVAHRDGRLPGPAHRDGQPAARASARSRRDRDRAGPRRSSCATLPRSSG